MAVHMMTPSYLSVFHRPSPELDALPEGEKEREDEAELSRFLRESYDRRQRAKFEKLTPFFLLAFSY